MARARKVPLHAVVVLLQDDMYYSNQQQSRLLIFYTDTGFKKILYPIVGTGSRLDLT